MRTVRLVDFGIIHAVVTSPESRCATARTWCGKTFRVGAYTFGGGEPGCKSCLRALAGPLGPLPKWPKCGGWYHVDVVSEPISDKHQHWLEPEEVDVLLHEHKGGRHGHDHLDGK